MEKEKKLTNKILYLAAGVIVIGIILLVFNVWNNFEKKEIKVNFIVGERPGFDLNSSALTFGSITPGGSASRDLVLKNNFKDNVFVSISASKDISKIMSISDNDFYLLPEEEKRISFSVFISKNSSYKDYEGDIKISIKKYDWFI